MVKLLSLFEKVRCAIPLLKISLLGDHFIVTLYPLTNWRYLIVIIESPNVVSSLSRYVSLDSLGLIAITISG